MVVDMTYYLVSGSLSDVMNWKEIFNSLKVKYL